MPSLSSFDHDPPQSAPRNTAGTTAWVLVFLDGMVLAWGSLYWLARGRFFDENLYEAIAGTSWTTLSASYPAAERVISAAVRLAGVIGICASVLLMTIAVTGFRARERWAWYAVWSLPLYCSLEIATLASYRALTPTAAVWDVGLLVTSLFALVTPYRWFFTREEPTAALS